MFHRRDIVPLFFLFLVIVTIMITLSQILVVHNKHHPVATESRDVEKFKAMLVQLENHINSMLKRDVLPLQKYREAFAAELYAEQINSMLKKEEMKNRHMCLQRKPLRKRANIHKYQRRHKLSRTGHKQRYPWNQFDIRNRKERIYPINSYVANNLTDFKSSRSLLIQERGNETGITRTASESNDTDGHVDVFSTLLAGERSVLNRVTDDLEARGKSFWSTGHQDRRLTSCPEYPPNLVGRLIIRTRKKITRVFVKRHADIEPGGHWAPTSCVARNKVAIIIPYRNRTQHLHTLLYYLIPVLKRQQSEFQIFVVEQSGTETFNKGIVMNAGFKEAVRIAGFPCYVFHDVDLIPEDDRNIYACSDSPRHLSVAVDKFKYILPYIRLVGGVFAIRREDFEKVNGYSNLYWGWGAEDDDMDRRIEETGMDLSRPPISIARYKMLKHEGRVKVPHKWSTYLLKTVRKRFVKDGLNSLDYNVTFIHKNLLYTHIMIDVGDPPQTAKNISAIIR